MKFKIRSLVLLVCLMGMIISMTGCAGCTLVEPGYVGIKVNLNGTDQGTEKAPLVTGRIWYNTYSQRIYKFPTFIQRAVWCKAVTEGKAIDESIWFSSKEGTQVGFDVGTAYKFEEKCVPEMFTEFRKTPEEITDGYYRDKVRAGFTKFGSEMPLTDIVGGSKGKLQENVTAWVKEQVAPKCIMVEQITINSNPYFQDEKIQASINSVFESSRQAEAEEKKVAVSEAKRKQALIDADSDRQTAVLRATGQAEANELIQKSLSSALVNYTAIQKWDGKLPTVSGNVTPFINLSSVGEKK